MAIIKKVLKLIRQKINESFTNADPTGDDWVVLSNVVDHEGHPYEEAQNKVVMYLANIQHETVISTNKRTMPVGQDQFAVVAPTIYINLYILFFANFYNKNYHEGLAMISYVISFFQQNHFFNHENLPSLRPC